MKKKISILGSTGSIGETSLKIILKEKKLFKINTLVANSNFKKILKQIKTFKPKYYVVADKKVYRRLNISYKFKHTKIVSNYDKIKEKNDFTIVAIPGLASLKPTIQFIKSSKKILLANKEAIICGWNLIKKTAKKYNSIIVPIDSEHFSIAQLIKDIPKDEIDKIYLTASGGPFLNFSSKKMNKVKLHHALRHPKWSMGKKISIDSATLMNKILELIEASKLFSFPFNKFQIIIHPQSLVHAIVKFKSGITKFLYHQPDMIVPISNAINEKNNDIKKYLKEKIIDSKLQNLSFIEVPEKNFPIIKLLPKLNKYPSTAIIINAANEILVDQFLLKKISFNTISKSIFRVLKDKNYKKYAIHRAKKLNEIFKIDSWARKTTIKILAETKK